MTKVTVRYPSIPPSINMCPIFWVAEVYVCRVWVAYALMWPLIVSVVDEFLMRSAHVTAGL
jgi:hypothetical protein